MVIRALRWLQARGRDLFYDATNAHLDNGRCLGYLFALSLIGAAIWNMHLGLEIHIGEFGTALTAVLGALVVYIYHDRKSNGS